MAEQATVVAPPDLPSLAGCECSPLFGPEEPEGLFFPKETCEDDEKIPKVGACRTLGRPTQDLLHLVLQGWRGVALTQEVEFDSCLPG